MRVVNFEIENYHGGDDYGDLFDFLTLAIEHLLKNRSKTIPSESDWLKAHLMATF